MTTYGRSDGSLEPGNRFASKVCIVMIHTRDPNWTRKFLDYPKYFCLKLSPSVHDVPSSRRERC